MVQATSTQLPSVSGLAGPSSSFLPQASISFHAPPGWISREITSTYFQKFTPVIKGGCVRNVGGPEEALSASDPVFLATGSPFLLSINKAEHFPHLFPLHVQVCFEIHSRTFDSRCGLILASALIPINLRRVCTHYLPPSHI